MSGPRTYLDYNATAPLRPEAKAAICAALEHVGNASSVHGEGRKARDIIETAREQVAALVNAKPSEVVFTGGATEANNWALRAGWSAVFVAAFEHESVLAAGEASDARRVPIPVGATGSADLAACDLTAAPNRSLLTLQMANNETGVRQDICAAAEWAHARGIAFHTDAAQTVGRIAIDFAALRADLMSLSGHKFGGPQGIGALVIRDGFELAPFLKGGGQERRRRAGTENAAAIAGLGAAAEAAAGDRSYEVRIVHLRNRLEAGVRKLTSSAIIIGSEGPRLPNTSCIAMPGRDAATLVIKLDLAGVAVGAGSACSSGKLGRSHILAAMGIAEAVAASAIRVSLGYGTTERDIDEFLAAWAQIHGRATTVASASAAQVRATPELETAGD
jgi:cysteine desulfurase